MWPFKKYRYKETVAPVEVPNPDLKTFEELEVGMWVTGLGVLYSGPYVVLGKDEKNRALRIQWFNGFFDGQGEHKILVVEPGKSIKTVERCSALYNGKQCTLTKGHLEGTGFDMNSGWEHKNEDRERWQTA